MGPGCRSTFGANTKGFVSYLTTTCTDEVFPNRVGHIVLDEPIDPVEYIERSSFPTWLDRVVTSNNNLKSFAVACAEPNGPGCPTAMRYRNENDILREAIQGLAVARVAHTSQVRRSEAHPDHQIFEDDLARGLRSEPAVWDFSSSVYQGLSLQTSTSQGFSKFVVNLQWQLIKLESHDFENWMTPTICGDKAEPFLTNISSLNAVKEEIINNVLSVHHDSPLLGRSFPAAFYLCHMWPTRATERYLGPWDHQPANPVLVIGSKLSVTGSYDHALAVAEQLGDAAVFIEQGGLGDVFGYSKRLQNIITEYLRDGTVPTEDARLVSPK
ncbi:hypothetical protein CERSUDRAFT_118396 [Gelatoporia subvermispora B]|uniref:Peptidase S33 tripeptidyl aminopeptidase-like C-terminal domain-containing protein n=1 Tax=Ceriporiopsis subvermispora (strain B) TaxID=914234 RepID=M2PBM6_CERS8|nr:hypothetical protein CERSUDRAFT_118396 [Gelatoporia subvermispora B]